LQFPGQVLENPTAVEEGVVESLEDDFEQLFLRAYAKTKFRGLTMTTDCFPLGQLVDWVIGSPNIDTSMVKKQKKLRGPNIESLGTVAEIPSAQCEVLERFSALGQDCSLQEDRASSW